MCNNNIKPGTPFWVVRTPFLGAFCRAFLTEQEAQEYIDGTNFPISMELSHEPDNRGCIFPEYNTKQENN